MKVAISIGHNPQRQGATIFGQISEYGETAAVVGQCIKHFTRAGHECHIVGTGPLEYKVEEANRLNADIAVEVHLNAANGRASGCETLYCPGSEEGKLLAESIQRYLADAVGNRDRGAKEGWYRMNRDNGPDYFLEQTNCPAVIVEPYFIDAEHGLKADNWTSEKIAMAILTGAEEFMEDTA